MLKLITDSAHYTEVLARVPKVKRSLWIGTADIKDLYVKVDTQTKPFLAVLAQLIKKRCGSAAHPCQGARACLP